MGKSFSCRSCGQCCVGTGGIVVDEADLKRLCVHLNLDEVAFEARYCERKRDKLFVRAQDGACIFFHKNSGCEVHIAKPSICKAWPFFRGNLIDAESFALAKEYCPGIPATQDFKDFVEEGLEYLQANGLVRTETGRAASALRTMDLFSRVFSQS